MTISAVTSKREVVVPNSYCGNYMKVLILEEDPGLAALVSGHLSRVGFVTDTVLSGAYALEMLRQHNYEVMIMDLSMPDMDAGTLLAERMRTSNRNVPCIVVGEADSPEKTIRWLNAGVDDYLIKPFDLGELEARMRAVLRRTRAQTERFSRFANLHIDWDSGSFAVNGHYLALTRKEAGLLAEMLRMSPRVMTKEQLTNRLYSFDSAVSANAIEAMISRLRRKLTRAAAECRVETVRGVGYRFVA